MLDRGFSCNIHSQHTERGGRQKEKPASPGWRRSLGTTISTTTTTTQTLADEEVGEEEPQKTQSHCHSCSFRPRLAILGGITNRMQGLKFN